jgi:hypothetical protein
VRRSLSSLLLALALVCGTVALAAHVVDRVAVAPGRSEAALKAALRTPSTRAVLRDEVARRVAQQVPGVSVGRARDVAGRILADPRVADTAGSLLAASPDRRSRIVGALSMLRSRDPALADQVRARADRLLPRLRVPVLDRLGAEHERLLALRSLGATAAVVLAALALLLGPRRDRLLRRIGVWGLLAGVLGVALLWAGPRLLDGGSVWTALVAGGLDAARGDLVPLFVGLLIGGVLLLATGTAAGTAARGPATGGRSRGTRRGDTVLDR